VRYQSGGTRVQVQFQSAGVKTLIQEFANMQVVDV
jgi:hypothetical protein